MSCVTWPLEEDFGAGVDATEDGAGVEATDEGAGVAAGAGVGAAD